MTNCSRGIRNAWYFHHAWVFVCGVMFDIFGVALLKL
nr:DUF3265 domain-containing protein [Vibrio campbellii]